MRLRTQSPDARLKDLKQEELQALKGHLKIYLGYAAGVGKTYAMLQAARRLKDSGVDVVVGYVETHGRMETEGLLEGLEVIPRRQQDYKGVTLEEFDLDAALEREPSVLLVDELAHTNVAGSRHPKRYQDVLELLEAGIDVQTTLNIQHLESVNDVVKQITGVEVKETLPDQVLGEASKISLVDIPPEELLERLSQGKVYLPDRASRAAQNFFRRGNLLALREIALREAAHRVDEDVRIYRKRRSIDKAWPAGERLLVCVGPSPSSRRLVRATRRLADALDASWIALHVSSPGLSAPERDRVARHLEFAQSLGAEVRTITDESLVEATARFAGQENVTKIVAGKPLGRRWQDVFTGTVVDQILKRTQGVDFLVVGSETAQEQETSPRPSLPKLFSRPYLVSTALLVVATGAGYPLLSWLNPANKVLYYLAIVVCVAYFFGRGPALVVSALSVVFFNFLFVPPYHTFSVADPEYILTFLGLFLTGLLVSSLTSRARDTAISAQERESQAVTLLSVSRDLSSALSEDRVAELALEHLENLYGPVRLLLASQELPSDSGLNASEFAVADWAYRKQQKAGRGTDTLPGGENQWHPLISGSRCLGVVGLAEGVHAGRTAESQLLEAILSQVASALERLDLARSARESELLKATEKLQTALLNSISHDLRIPLVSINGALSSLLERDLSLEENAQRQMIENALSEADRLTRLVTNLLQMTRMESGVVEIKAVPCDPWDLVTTTVSSLSERIEERGVTLDLPEELPLVPMDYVLIQQVVANLIENSIRHGEGKISVQVRTSKEGMEFGVWDEGNGVPSEIRPRIFDRFFRASEPGDGGAGLGLSICKGLVEAHGGRIWLENGREFRFVLPLEKK
jgi:two-component system, OmpR family, sensor histidine kinase KdpD